MKRLSLLVGAALVVCGAGAQAATLQKADVEKLITSQQQAKVPGDFSAFLKRVAKTNPALKASIAAYKKQAPLTGDDLVNIARLLGIYNRLRNEGDVVAALGKMVAIPTALSDKYPQHESPAIKEFGQLVEKMAKDFGLQYRNVDNRIFEVKLLGKGSDEFGLLTHSDVVPAIADEWVLDDGTKLDPYKLQRVGERLYGRGSMDDKGSIATVLYAMKAVRDSGVPLQRTLRLMIETTEETSGAGIKYYIEKNAVPEYNIVLDSKYPAVVAEKGTGALRVYFSAQPAAAAQAPASAGAGGNGAAVIAAMSGAASYNTIPQTAKATLRGADLAQLANTLNAAKDAFVQKYASPVGKFSIDVTAGADSVEVKVSGVSGHGARPEDAVNPLPRLALFLSESGVTWDDNAYARAVKYVCDLYGTGYLAEKMGVAYQDAFMGPLTMSPNQINEKEGRVEVVANVRMPRGDTPDGLKQKIAQRVNAWAAANQIKLTVEHNQGNWMARDPNGAWLSTLLNIFGEVTGQEAKPVPTAGSTTAKMLPNAINFGPVMPGKFSPAHSAKEYKELADLELDIQMFTEMLVRIGNLKQMQ